MSNKLNDKDIENLVTKVTELIREKLESEPNTETLPAGPFVMFRPLNRNVWYPGIVEANGDGVIDDERDFFYWRDIEYVPQTSIAQQREIEHLKDECERLRKELDRYTNPENEKGKIE